MASFIERAQLNIVLEYCDGGDLSQSIKARRTTKKPFSEMTVMYFFVQICSALYYIHSRRVLHRDLKTQNIFMMKNYHIKLGDFGIAKVRF